MSVLYTRDKNGNLVPVPCISVGTDGADGGYYVPTVAQLNSNTIEVTYAPSSENMPVVAPVQVILPAGLKGEPGYTPQKGVDYYDGKDGKDGSPGKDGANGSTPVKGVDYYTDADKTEMVNEVIAALPVYDGEVVAV